MSYTSQFMVVWSICFTSVLAMTAGMIIKDNLQLIRRMHMYKYVSIALVLVGITMVGGPRLGHSSIARGQSISIADQLMLLEWAQDDGVFTLTRDGYNTPYYISATFSTKVYVCNDSYSAASLEYIDLCTTWSSATVQERCAIIVNWQINL